MVLSYSYCAYGFSIIYYKIRSVFFQAEKRNKPQKTRFASAHVSLINIVFLVDDFIYIPPYAPCTPSPAPVHGGMGQHHRSNCHQLSTHELFNNDVATSSQLPSFLTTIVHGVMGEHDSNCNQFPQLIQQRCLAAW